MTIISMTFYYYQCMQVLTPRWFCDIMWSQHCQAEVGWARCDQQTGKPQKFLKKSQVLFSSNLSCERKVSHGRYEFAPQNRIKKLNFRLPASPSTSCRSPANVFLPQPASLPDLYSSHDLWFRGSWASGWSPLAAMQILKGNEVAVYHLAPWDATMRIQHAS